MLGIKSGENTNRKKKVINVEMFVSKAASLSLNGINQPVNELEDARAVTRTLTH